MAFDLLISPLHSFPRFGDSLFITSMKSPRIPKRMKISALALTVLALTLPILRAEDGIYNQFGLDLGFAGRTHEWAVYTYGSGTSSAPFTALDVSSPSNLAPDYQIEGDIALAGVYSRLNVSGWGSIHGDRYEQQTSTESVSGHGVLSGNRISNASTDSLLNGGVNSLRNVSNTAAGLASSPGSPTKLVLGKGDNPTFSNIGNPFNGKYVMNLTDFVMGGGSTLTLNGASGSAFVLNISGNFNIGGGSKILLTGGLNSSDVLFNVVGNNSSQKNALPFQIGGDSTFTGTLLAYNRSGAPRSLSIDGHNTAANGEVIANQAAVSSGAKVKPPKKSKK